MGARNQEEDARFLCVVFEKGVTCHLHAITVEQAGANIAAIPPEYYPWIERPHRPCPFAHLRGDHTPFFSPGRLAQLSQPQRVVQSPHLLLKLEWQSTNTGHPVPFQLQSFIFSLG